MNVSGSETTIMGDVINRNEDNLSLQTGIKSYKDEYLTGLTEEELAEIKKEAKKYLDENTVKTKEDREAYEKHIASLLKKYGYKGDIDDYAVTLGMAAENEYDEEQAKKQQSGETAQPDSLSLYQRSTLSSMSVKNKFFYEGSQN